MCKKYSLHQVQKFFQQMLHNSKEMAELTDITPDVMSNMLA